MSIYLQIENVVGDCLESKHKGWIVVQSLTEGVEKKVDFDNHNMSSPIISRPKHQSIVLSKKMCPASPILKQMASEKIPFSFNVNMTKTLSTNSGGIDKTLTEPVFVQLKYQQAYITQYTLSAFSNMDCEEHIEIFVGAYEMNCIFDQNLEGATSKNTANYDFLLQKKIS